MPIKAASWWKLFRESGSKWNRDNVMRRAAALSFYALFSIGPLLILVTAVAGLAFGEEAIRGELSAQMRGLMGEEVARAAESWVASGWKSGDGPWATVLGLLGLIVGATGGFAELNSSLTEIWEVKIKSTSGVLSLLRSRLLSFVMAVVIGVLLVASMLVSTVIAGVSKFLSTSIGVPIALIQTLDWTASLLATTVLFAMIFKILPAAKIWWRDVAVGAFVTSILFTIGKVLIGIYLGSESLVSSFGASASVALVVLWTFYSSMILFYGAEFTAVYARTFGSLCSAKPLSRKPPGRIPSRPGGRAA